MFYKNSKLVKTGKNWWFVLLYPPSFCESFFNFFTLFQVGLNQLYKVLKNVENISTILANFQKEKKKKNIGNWSEIVYTLPCLNVGGIHRLLNI